MSVHHANFYFPKQKRMYSGKVRDCYVIDDLFVMVTTDRISCFDVILPRPIPYKGAVLSGITKHFLEATKDLAPNWLLASPHPNVLIGHKCEPIMVEVIVRGYMVGSLWRAYQKGERTFCGVPLPDDLEEFQALPKPIVTPTTKAEQGQHDENITPKEILEQKLCTEEEWKQIEQYALAIFQRGSELAIQKGLILVDTKIEFGRDAQGKIMVIDELLTPDSSRYFLDWDYQESRATKKAPKQLSKEFVRDWLVQQGWNGSDPQQPPPELPQKFIQEISERYLELYETITGQVLKTETAKVFQTIMHYLMNRCV